MNLSESIGQWWQYLVAGASALGVAAASHLKVRDRVKTLEIRQVVIEEKSQTLEETHDTVIRLEGRMTMLETDLRNSGEAFAVTMKETRESQARVESNLDKIGRLIQL
jgi:uncharacterized protein HemX